MLTFPTYLIAVILSMVSIYLANNYSFLKKENDTVPIVVAIIISLIPAINIVMTIVTVSFILGTLITNARWSPNIQKWVDKFEGR